MATGNPATAHGAPHPALRPGRGSAVGGSSCSIVPAALPSRGTLMQPRATAKSQRTGLQSEDVDSRASRVMGIAPRTGCSSAPGMRTGGRARARPAALGGGAMPEASGLNRIHMGPAWLRRELQLVSASEADQRSMLQWAPLLELPRRQPMCVRTRVPRRPRGTS